MADVKISALPSATSVTTSTVIPVVQGGTTEKATLAQVSAAITGNYTFSANTISLPNFTDASIDLVGLTTRSVPVYNPLGIPTGSGSGGGYTFPPTGTYELSSSLTWESTYGVSLTLTTLFSPTVNQDLLDSVSYWNIGDTFDFVYAVGASNPFTLVSTTLTLTSIPVEQATGNPSIKTWTFNVDKVIPADRSTNFSPNTVAINNYPYKTNSTYTFNGSGEFISDSALIGNVYVSDNIITPMPIVTIDAYGQTTSTPQPLVINGNSQILGNLQVLANNITLGTAAGATNQGDYSVAIGLDAGNISQGANAVAIGHNAGYNNQGANSIAIGRSAGITLQGERGVAIGLQAGYQSQGTAAVAIGAGAGFNTQSNQTVAIGGGAGNDGQQYESVAVGAAAGGTAQQQRSVAVGSSAGAQNQGSGAVALGYTAGYDTQGNNAVAIGTAAGGLNGKQGDYSIAIGMWSGTATGGARGGANAISIGYQAGMSAVGNNAMVLNSSGQLINSSGANTIVLNATTPANPYISQANSFFVNPVRNGGTGGSLPSGFYQMAYNPTTKEIIYWS